ncbi:hypothetical protein EHQ86_09145 [Leptospira yasudae]|nr:hypothetical protein EHQ86_09145 [Leptospira yasudae]
MKIRASSARKLIPCGRDGGVVNKLGYRIILIVTLLSFNLLTGAESPFSGKRFETPSLFLYPTFQNNNIFSPKPARALTSYLAAGDFVDVIY